MYYFCKALVWIYMHIAYRLRYKGRKNIPKRTAVIYASNHRSYADPPLVGAGGRGKYAFMAKEELFRNKFFSLLIRSLGAFPVSRGKGDTEVIDRAVEKLSQKRSLMIFPEGTRSKDGKVGRGHGGAALISARSGCLIVPVGIVYGEKLRFRSKLQVIYGEPIDPAEYVTIGDEPNPRQLVRLKKRYMADIKRLVEGKPEKNTETVTEGGTENE